MSYLVPFICTLLIGLSLFLHWRKFKNIYIIISTLILYYWSIAGSWFFILDQQNPQLGKDIGIHYHIYLQVLYPVQVDATYFKSIIYYSLFILAFIWGSYIFLKNKHTASTKTVQPIKLNPVFLLLPAVIGMLISYFTVHDILMASIRHYKSFYWAVNTQPDNRFHTLHLAANTLMAISIYTFLGILLSPNGKFVCFDKSSRFFYRAGIFLMVFVLAYLILLGGRNYFIFGALLIFVVAYENTGFKHWMLKISVGFLLLIVPLFLTELTRGTPVVSLALEKLKATGRTSSTEDDGFFFEEEREASYEVSGSSTLHSLLFSNEMFVPSFSMYAVLKEDIPLTYGKSFQWLASSVIPSFVGLERPEDSYKHYIKYTKAAEITNQGFTIHHATGWYINFGVIGVMIGGVLLSLIMSLGYKKYMLQWKKVARIIWFSVFAGTFIFMPRIIRAGPEAYKSIFMIAILFMATILLCGTLFTTKKVENR